MKGVVASGLFMFTFGDRGRGDDWWQANRVIQARSRPMWPVADAALQLLPFPDRRHVVGAGIHDIHFDQVVSEILLPASSDRWWPGVP
jgi:hypothetical protein